MKLLFLKTNGTKFFSWEKEGKTLWICCNFIPKYFGTYIEIELL